MEVVAGALPSVITKLGDLLVGEYNLQKGVKGEIRFLQSELESMQGALQKVSNTPADQIDNQDRIWARDLRELSYDIEDSIDTFMVRCNGDPGHVHGFKKVVDRCLNLLMQPKIRRKIATEIRDIKSRVEDVAARRHRYKIDSAVVKPVKVDVTVDPRILSQYEKAIELVGVDKSREEVIQALMEGNEVSQQQKNTVSIVGFGGLGKTTLATTVYEKLRTQFDCLAFISVSQTPDTEKLFKDLLYQLTKEKNASINVINELRQFLENKRYFIVIDDIWDISVWKMLKCALPDNNVGYKIITTTRNLDVAKEAGGVYKLNPLSLDNSRKLLYRRIFGNENKGNDEDTEKYPEEELVEVTDRILRKCAGVPLAIITMASLLACKSRNKIEWYKVYKSIGTGLDNSLDAENMRKILSFSYYDMPSHLRTCLLYLSMFPEDYKIDKDGLIRMWIAEGFIPCEKQAKKSLLEVGESYFNELINRSMIQPIHDNYSDMMLQCRVHDMVLDLIRSLSSEENFVTILNGTDHISASNSIRRLSLQYCKEDHAMTWASRSLQQVRSVVIFSSAIDLIPTLGSFSVLRVLDLQVCDLSQGDNIKYLGNLFHLRYLGLRSTEIGQLPKEIGNMQWLQTLDIRDNEISSLPSTVVQLRNLMCLYIDQSTRVPNGIGGLTCLEELSYLGIKDSNVGIIEEVSRLRELRVLKIVLTEWSDKLVECLPKLPKIQNLSIMVMNGGQRNMGGLDAWVAPVHLRWLYIRNCCWFSTLPAWLKPSHLPDLSYLKIAVRELRQDGLEILGRLPALRYLHLEVDRVGLGILERFVVRARSFPCLGTCSLRGFVRPVVFEKGAMPRLRLLWLLRFSARVAREIANGLELGLGNLQSIQEVSVSFRYEDEEVMDKAKAALRREAEIHPNRPRIKIW